MKITLKHRSEAKTQTEVDVTFPFYRTNDTSDYVTSYTKRISPTETMTVRHDVDGGFEIEVSAKDYMAGDTSSLDYQLGRGFYACTAEKFNSLLASAQALLKRFD